LTWQHELKVLNPELADILESGGSDIGKKLQPAVFFFSINHKSWSLSDRSAGRWDQS
jgi:hypothetical protein